MKTALSKVQDPGQQRAEVGGGRAFRKSNKGSGLGQRASERI